jgi:hypothetical protein
MKVLAALAVALPLASGATGQDAVTLDAWDVRYCEFLLVTGSPGRYEAEVYSTFGLDPCEPEAFRAADADALKRRFGVLAVFKDGPRHWVASTLTVDAAALDAPTADFGGIAARLAGLLQVTPARRLGPAAYLPVAARRVAASTHAAGRPVFILDDPDGTPWVMQSYSRAVAPGLGLADLPDLGGRLSLPPGWSFRGEVFERDLTVRPAEGARVLQDDLDNSYAECTEAACSFPP